MKALRSIPFSTYALIVGAALGILAGVFVGATAGGVIAVIAVIVAGIDQLTR
jgi:hypothetical protein